MFCMSFYSGRAENLFGSYLAGLIEGDESIIVRVGKSEKVSPAIIFTFHEREKPLFEKLKLQRVFNSGSLYKESNGDPFEDIHQYLAFSINFDLYI